MRYHLKWCRLWLMCGSWFRIQLSYFVEGRLIHWRKIILYDAVDFMRLIGVRMCDANNFRPWLVWFDFRQWFFKIKIVVVVEGIGGMPASYTGQCNTWQCNQNNYMQHLDVHTYPHAMKTLIKMEIKTKNLAGLNYHVFPLFIYCFLCSDLEFSA